MRSAITRWHCSLRTRWGIEAVWRFAELTLAVTIIAFVCSCSPGDNSASRVQPEKISLVAPQYLTVNGEIVHPGCVNELIGSIADPFPIVTAVDVEGIRRSNKYCTKPTMENGWVSFQDKDVLGKNARLRYKLIGTMPKQIFVLKVFDVTGGSAVFGWLLFVKIEKDTVPDAIHRYRKRMILRGIGYVGLGDRNHPTVELKVDRVIVGPSETYPKGRIISVISDGCIQIH